MEICILYPFAYEQSAVLNLFPVLWHSDVDLFVLALLVNEFLNDQKNQSVYMYFASVQL